MAAVLMLSFQNQIFAQKAKPELTGVIWADPANRPANVRTVEITVAEGGSGTYRAIMTNDESLPTHTIYRPANLKPFEGMNKLPIVVYGNGACRDGSQQVRELLTEIASHGFIVLAVGPIRNAIFGPDENSKSVSDPKALLDAITWVVAQNSNKESVLFEKIDVNKVAAMGQSCGGIMAMGASSDPRITTTVMLNSGIFITPPTATANSNERPSNANAPRSGMARVVKSDLKSLHGPIAYFTGGEYDGATVNAADDFRLIDKTPVFHGSYDFSEKVNETGNKSLGHYPATYREPNGGDFAIAAVAWLKWQLKGDNEAAKMFKGNPCGLVKNKKWTVSKKNID